VPGPRPGLDPPVREGRCLWHAIRTRRGKYDAMAMSTGQARSSNDPPPLSTATNVARELIAMVGGDHPGEVLISSLNESAVQTAGNIRAAHAELLDLGPRPRMFAVPTILASDGRRQVGSAP